MSPSMDIVADLRQQAEQLLNRATGAKFGNDCYVRVLAPDILYATMMDAADEIEDLRAALHPPTGGENG